MTLEEKLADLLKFYTPDPGAATKAVIGLLKDEGYEKRSHILDGIRDE